jgi:hypothetical protein
MVPTTVPLARASSSTCAASGIVTRQRHPAAALSHGSVVSSEIDRPASSRSTWSTASENVPTVNPPVETIATNSAV